MTRKFTRRQFMRLTGGAGIAAGAAMALPWAFDAAPAWAFAQTPTVRKFVTALPGLGASGANSIGQYIPLATKHSKMFAGRMTDVYKMAAAPFTERMHPDLPGKTHFLGYYDRKTGDSRYLGGVIVAKRGTPVLLNMANQLPNRAIIPVDPMVMAGPGGVMTGDLPLNRMDVHMHGGFTPWFSDGTPLQWFDPKGLTGASFMNVPGTHVPKGSANYYYPMDQSARLAWYHDHAMGITRTNVYAGLASALLIVDDFEIGLVHDGMLPDLVGIPLIIQDKAFVSENICKTDPTWRWGGPGDLWYPHVYEPNVNANGTTNPKGRWDWGPTVVPPSQNTMAVPVPASLIPEAFFDTILVNGGLYPTASVPPKRVRFRMLNGSQARFYHLTLRKEDGSVHGEANVGPNGAGPVMYQIGTEGGFLPAVAVHDNTQLIPLPDPSDPTTASPDGPFNVLLAPAERCDVVIDFNGVPAGTSFILYNDAPAPFPGGDARNDYFTGDLDLTAAGGAPSTAAGMGPNTRTLFKITVGAGSGDTVATPRWLAKMNSKLMGNFASGNQPGLLYNGGAPWIPKFPFDANLLHSKTVVRQLSLNEDFDEMGRLIQTMGTMTSMGTDNQGLPTWGLPYLDPASETPHAGDTEVWQIFNLTMDVHPMHIHLVNGQLIQRQPFTGDPTNWSYSGPPTPPDANEMGWKETVRVNPGESATMIMKFDLPKLPTAEMRNARSPRTGGHEYVWHCHILEHEEHDMMRPLIVK
jgi:spore coat protein A